VGCGLWQQVVQADGETPARSMLFLQSDGITPDGASALCGGTELTACQPFPAA